MARSLIKKYRVVEFIRNEKFVREDFVIEESPLEVEICNYEDCKSLVIMRTPIDDEYLVLGFAFTQGLISSIDEVKELEKVHENKIRIRDFKQSEAGKEFC